MPPYPPELQQSEVAFRHLGEIDYQKAWDYQTELFDHTVQQKIENRNRTKSDLTPIPTPNHLLFCSHPHVYTLGKSGKEEHLLLDDTSLKTHSATYYKINRGGDITYHGPGQIVGYPILDLENFFTDIVLYLRHLEEGVIRTLAEYQVTSARVEGLTGVWIDGDSPAKARKICALGVKASRWVTMHGFAFNVNADLSYFGHIVPCGIDDKAVTSLHHELGRQVDQSEVEAKLRKHLADIFGWNETLADES